MSQLLILCILFASFATTLAAGAGWTFVTIYLPVMVLLSHVPEVNVIPHVPIAAMYAPLYGILLAMPLRRDSLRFQWCSIDTVMLLLLISATVTAWTTEWYETALMTCRNDFLMWYAPYFLSRIAFKQVKLRSAALNVLIVLIGILSFAAIIEARLQPYWFLHELQNAGLGARVPAMAYHRFGINRVSGPVAHPIYFGNMCLVMLGLVAVLARTSGRKLTNPWVALALLGAVGCVGLSASGTPYLGLLAGAALAITLLLIPMLRLFVIPITLCLFLGLFAVSYQFAHTPLGVKSEGELAGSYYTRQMIVHQSWNKAAAAGPLGFGRNFNDDDTDDFDLSSVDNSYFLLTITRGWIYLTLWVSLGVLMSVRMTLAFVKVKHKSQVFPLVVGFSTALAIMVSMYTVWPGALYVVIWMILLGLCNTLIDLILYPQPMVLLPPGTQPGTPSAVTVRQVPPGPRVGLLPAGAAMQGRTA